MIDRLSSAVQGSAHASAEQETGENYPLEVRIVADEVLGLLVKLVNDIYTNIFKASGLIRLRHCASELNPDNNTVASIGADGSILFKTKEPTPKDFKSEPFLFLECMLVYKWIFYRFHPATHPGASAAMTRFIGYIARQAQLYNSSMVVEFAARRIANSFIAPCEEVS